MHRVREMVAAVIFIVLAALTQVPLQAQADTAGTATVSGTVLDPSGNPIQQAAIAVKNEASGAVRGSTTAADGRFSVGNLPAGTYSVDASATGFQQAAAQA